jgi:hypothetical protein
MTMRRRQNVSEKNSSVVRCDPNFSSLAFGKERWNDENWHRTLADSIALIVEHW